MDIYFYLFVNILVNSWGFDNEVIIIVNDVQKIQAGGYPPFKQTSYSSGL